MTRIGWFIVNLALFAAAVAATRAVLQPAPQPPAPAGNQTPEAQNPRRPASKIPGIPPRAHQALVQTAVREIDSLWKNTLFRPERTEEVQDGTGKPAAKKPGPEAQFELLGIGKIGERAAAIILVKSHTLSRRPYIRPLYLRTRTVNRAHSGRTSRPKAETPHVYMLGASIEDTGYVLKKIEPDQVVLAKGDEEKILKLDRGDTGSLKRNEAAAREEKARNQKAAAHKAKPLPRKKTRPVVSPGRPPPPPPAPPPAAVPGPGRGPAGLRSRQTPAPRKLSARARMLRILAERRRIEKMMKKQKTH